jgi:dTMP kinase
MPGQFVTFEGGEGGGKSTQFARLARHIRATGRTVVETREPGGTPQGESLRALLVTGATERWSAEAEALLNYAARDAHLRLLIRPALARGETVISDRFMDSTRAYQAIAGGCSEKLIDDLEEAIVGTTRPGLTIILDIDPELGLARARSRGAGMEDRYERKGLDFHRRIRAAFRSIAESDPARCRMIDASRSEDVVTTDIIAAYEEATRG